MPTYTTKTINVTFSGSNGDLIPIFSDYKLGNDGEHLNTLLSITLPTAWAVFINTNPVSYLCVEYVNAKGKSGRSSYISIPSPISNVVTYEVPRDALYAPETALVFTIYQDIDGVSTRIVKSRVVRCTIGEGFTAGSVTNPYGHDIIQQLIDTISTVSGNALTLGETSTTAYRGDRGKAAYDHSQEVTGNPHNVTATEVGLGNVDNTADLNKPISSATQTALDDKAELTNVSSTYLPNDIDLNTVFTPAYEPGIYIIKSPTGTVTKHYPVINGEYNNTTVILEVFKKDSVTYQRMNFHQVTGIKAYVRTYLSPTWLSWELKGIDSELITGLEVDANGRLILSTGYEIPTTASLDAKMELDGSNSNIDKLSFDTTPSVDAISEGQLRWNNSDETLDLGMNGGDVTLQIGQESQAKVLNLSGATILNGDCVYIDTASGGRPTVKLANNKSGTMARKTIGIITKDILNGAEGKVTIFGKVRNINTLAFNLGDILYVSETDGALTNVLPENGRWITNVGIVTVKSATLGEIFVRSIQYEKPNELSLINGFPNNTDTTISVNAGIFTIAPVGAEFRFYQQGIQYRKLTSESLAITDTEGLHFFYYDLGVLTEAINPSNGIIDNAIRTKCIVAQVYWDATNNLPILLGNERHGFVMSAITHAYLHFTQGAKWVEGMALNTINATGNGSLDAHAQFGVDSGVGTDEDLSTMPSAKLSTVGLPIFYLDGASASLRRFVKSGFSVIMDTDVGVGVTGRLVYNRNLAGTWSLQTVSSDDYVLCHVFETNDLAQPYISFVGQSSYLTLPLARTGAQSEIATVITQFPKQELIPIATLIFQTNASYTNSVNARIVEVSTGVKYVDWRKTDIVASLVASPTDHNSLSGKQGGTAGEYYHLTNAEVGLVNGALQKTTNITAIDENGLTSGQEMIAVMNFDGKTIKNSSVAISDLVRKTDVAEVYGVRYLKSSSAPTGERTRSSIGKTATAGVGVAGTSGFDDCATYKLRTCNKINGVVTAYFGEPGFSTLNDTFVEMPLAYYRVWDDGTYINYEISKDMFYGASIHPAFKHNNTIQDKIYLASYKASYDGVSKHESKSGTLPDISISRPTSRTRSTARGIYASIQDVQVRDWLNILVMVEFATRDSQTAIGRGYCDLDYVATRLAVLTEVGVNRIVVTNANALPFEVGQEIGIGTAQGTSNVVADRTITAINIYDASNKEIVFSGASANITATTNMIFSTRQKNGKTDNIGQGTGCALGTNGKTSIRYRGIENPFGNVWEWVDNLNINNNQGYSDVQGRLALYNDTDVGTNYSAFNGLFPNTNNYMITPLIDTVTGLSCLPASVGGASNQYFCDYYFQNSGLRASCVGGDWNDGSNAGLWYWHLNVTSSDAGINLGSRLLEL